MTAAVLMALALGMQAPAQDHRSIARKKALHAEYSEAVAEFSKAIAESPQDAALYLERARARRLAGDSDRAQQDLQRAADLGVPAVDVLVEQGWLWDAKEETSKAIDTFSSAILLDAQCGAAYYGRGLLKRTSGRRQEGNRDLLKAAALEGNSWTLCFHRALSNAMLSQLGGGIDQLDLKPGPNRSLGDDSSFAKRALEDFDRVIRMEPEHATAYAHRAEIRTTLGRYQEAKEDCARAIQLSPRIPKPHFSQGRLHELTGDFKEAQQSYSKAVELDPTYAAAFYGRGLARGKLGDTKGSIEDYSKAIELDAYWPDAHINRALAREAADDARGAVDDYTKALELNPESITAWCYRGGAKDKLGDRNGARLDYAKAALMDAQSAFHYEVRAIAKEGISDTKGAVADYKKALEFYPLGSTGYERIRKTLQTLGK